MTGSPQKAALLLPALCVMLAAACAPLDPDHPPVPPPLAEQVPAPPRVRVTLIWQPGHYEWDGRTYLWQPGAWVERAGHGTLWQDGYWQRRGAQSVWVPAHWL